MGMPAVGKTTISNQLMLHFKQNGVHCYSFSYDQLMPEIIDFECEFQEEEKQSNMVAPAVGKWKAHRKMVFDLIKASVVYLRRNEYSNCLDTLTGGCECLEHRKSSSVESTWHVVLVDDNMFYRSMRYPFYQLCRTYECSFCQIYIKNDLDELILRNANREGIVTDATILKMARIYEAPDQQKFYWEKHSMELDNPEFNDQDMIKKLDLFISEVSLEIIPPLESERDKAERDRCRKEILESYVHQCDQILRKFISLKMNEVKNSTSDKKELRDKGSHLNNQRKRYLQVLRTQKQNVVDILSSEDWKRHEIIQFKSFLDQQ